MRTVFRPLMMAAVLAAMTAPAMADRICIDTRDIKNTTAKNGGAAMLFQMRDGSLMVLNHAAGHLPRPGVQRLRLDGA